MTSLYEDFNNENCVSKNKKLKNYFTEEEDKLVLKFVCLLGKNNWAGVAALMKNHGYNRNARQCRDRYFHNLDPRINNDSDWTKEEDDLLIKKVEEEGKRWKSFERYFTGRTEVGLRNRYHILIRKKVKKEIKVHEKIDILSDKFSFLDSYYDANIKPFTSLKNNVKKQSNTNSLQDCSNTNQNLIPIFDDNSYNLFNFDLSNII